MQDVGEMRAGELQMKFPQLKHRWNCTNSTVVEQRLSKRVLRILTTLQLIFKLFGFGCLDKNENAAMNFNELHGTRKCKAAKRNVQILN